MAKHKIQQMCDKADARTASALESLERNLQFVPIDDLEQFVEKYKNFTV